MAVDLSNYDEELQQIVLEHRNAPENVELIAQLCYAFNIRARHNPCMEFARQGLAISPHHANLFYELIIASSLDTSHILEEIVSELESILEKLPDDIGVLRNLALAHFYLEGDGEAEHILLEIVEGVAASDIDRQTYEVLAQVEHTRGHYEKAISYCDDAIGKPGPTARMIRLKGLCYQEMGQIEEAISLYRQALEQEPNFVWACHSLGTLYFELENYSQAFRYFGKASFINPRDPGNLFLLAECFMDAERYDLAMSELEKLLLCGPHKRIRAEVHNALGYLWLRKGEAAIAREHLSQAIELEPELSVAYFNMAEMARMEKNLPLAETQLKNAIDLDPQYADAWLELGYVHLEKKRFDEAEACFNNVLDMVPEEPYALMGLSKVEQQNGKYENMLKLSKRAFEADPEQAEICNNLGIAQECNKQWQAAEEAYIRALDLDPFQAAAANNLGHLYERLMKQVPEEAERYTKMAIGAWTKRLQICVAKGKSVQAAVTHLGKLGLSPTEIDLLAETPLEISAEA
jgi:tetratricopeptide (TPR) repeat protein